MADIVANLVFAALLVAIFLQGVFIMSLSVELAAAVVANTNAIQALAAKATAPHPVPTDMTPDADVQAAITQLQADTAAANAAAA